MQLDTLKRRQKCWVCISSAEEKALCEDERGGLSAPGMAFTAKKSMREQSNNVIMGSFHSLSTLLCFFGFHFLTLLDFII